MERVIDPMVETNQESLPVKRRIIVFKESCDCQMEFYQRTSAVLLDQIQAKSFFRLRMAVQIII